MTDSKIRFSARSDIDRRHNPAWEKLTELRQDSRPLIDLTLGNPTALNLGLCAARVLAPLSAPGVATYEPEPFGPLWARSNVARTFADLELEVDPQRIVLTASTSEAYAFLLKLLCDPGDDVLVPAPSYPLLEHLARFESVVTRPYQLAYDGAWHLDLPGLRARIGPRTRAILIVNPNNPTGHFLSEHELEALLELGLPIISDEVFASYPLELPAGRVRSVVGAKTGLVFALSGLSKLLALPQMKLAWIAVSGSALETAEALARLELIADAFLSPNAPALHALEAWIGGRNDVQRQINQRLTENLNTLSAAVEASPISRLPVEGGWYAPLRLPATESDEGWALGLLEAARVIVHPGYFFDFEGPPHVVVSLLPEPGEFRTGVTRLVDYAARR